MIVIREFMTTGGGHMNDAELMAMMRSHMKMAPVQQQPGWLHEVELALDAYGATSQMEASSRMREVIKQLAQEVAGRTVVNIST